MKKTLDEVVRGNRAAGYHYFDTETMKFFRCRILPGTYDLGNGITGLLTVERPWWVEGRVYRVVRYYHESGIAETAFDPTDDNLECFRDLHEARQYIERLEKEAQK